MELELRAIKYNTSGDLPSGQALAYLFDLNEADFGPAIRRIEITFLFAHPGPPWKTLEGLFETYHHYRATRLPRLSFRRSRETVEMEVASDLMSGDRDLFANELPLALFRDAAAEVVEALRLLRRSVKRKDDFRLEEFLSHTEAVLKRLPSTDAELAELTAAAAAAWEKRRAAKPWWEVLDIDWRDYHSTARELLNDPLFWDCANEFAPHGNDAGADLLASYKRWLWRFPDADPLEFYTHLLHGWGAEPGSQNPVFHAEVQDAAVALAFAELKFRGECRPSAAKLALDTLNEQQREAEEAVSWEHRGARLAAIDQLRAVLLRTGSAPPS